MKALIKSMENNDKGANVGRQSAEETIADVPGLIPAGEDGREEDNILRCCYLIQTIFYQFGIICYQLQLLSNMDNLLSEVYRRLARHSPRAEANIVKACNTMQWSHKIS